MEEITQCGHLVMFYPKSHCELNGIEYFREMESEGLANCATTSSIDGLREAVLKLLEATEEVRIPKWFRKSDLSERHIYMHQDGLACGSKEA